MSGVDGQLRTSEDGEVWWEVTGVDALAPFLVSLVGGTDVWAFLSTHGGLTAGRVDASRALFPYETDDRLHHAAGVTGPITLIRTPAGALWQPFDPRGIAPGRARILRKAAEGHWLELEERAPDLGLSFRMRWATGPRFGLVRRAALGRIGPAPASASPTVEILDGVLNLLPADVPRLAQQGLSALVDAYKRSEVHPSGLGIFAMEAHLSDQAAPAEALRANTVWRRGLPEAQTLLSEQAVTDFRAGRPTAARTLWFGQRGAYLVRASLDLAAGPVTWDLVGDVHLDHVALTGLIRDIEGSADVEAAIDADLAVCATRLRANVASADGLQHTADQAATVHHFANVVFNNMRGGVFADDHQIPVADLRAFLVARNRRVAARHDAFVTGLGDRIHHRALIERAEASADPQLVRLCLEYLPLTFSRRHGDPSRPWNTFTIRLRHPDGRPIYSYEGNWRDIFQNWEALCTSFPAFLEAIVAKFVNASTIDGFNPYRLLREGVDWEVPDPEDPWANIGYWGDHQIVYLFRLIEAAEAHRPGAIRDLLGRDLFSFAAVPYRIRPYDALVRNAKDTIEFDEAAQAQTEARSAELGGDGRLILGPDGEVFLVNLLEKLLITVLAKLSNFVADGGIWLNTQRPEWNDANNALVGQGLSVVTLAQLRRALAFLGPLVRGVGDLPVSAPVVLWFDAVTDALGDRSALTGSDELPIDPADRRRLLDRLGMAFSAYRAAVYAGPSVDRVPLADARVVSLCDAALAWVDRSLRTNRRPDGLYHSYNLLSLAPGEARVGHLYEMLEGQVAVLGSGMLAPQEAVALIDALFASRMYREDQHSFMLYPFRERPAFLVRNRVTPDVVDTTPLLRALVDAGDTRIIAADAAGAYRFHADFENAAVLADGLGQLGAEPRWAAAVTKGRAAVLAAYESVFEHHAFTGRSGTMYKYEGLGSIYWHMVSKLLLSVQEAYTWAADGGADPEVVHALADRYYRVRRGLSFNKTVAEYGAIPSDPYSHTPWHLGAQQPGMTGQVKEEVLTRLGELGVRVRDGELSFEPHLLRRSELLKAPARWPCLGPGGTPITVEIPAGAVAFTLAQVPIVLQVGGTSSRIEVTRADGRVEAHAGCGLSREATAALFARNGAVVEVRVTIPSSDLTLA